MMRTTEQVFTMVKIWYECGKFIIHFFNPEKVETLAKGFKIITIDNLEEGALPRKLYFVVQRKR